ncbi:hypothetical protein I5M27_04630 [Adhaeribacter sp. BT258]|uniref:Glycosyltransferase RgtA/B/C/D-like domain-containing protein n=1 Tax=Adhaeribacter terrigena TaxID=2793070 RepID=A0ABS1BYQ7_9BACT|nr:hypothetical protein [Adhaeribacter terrigena]MBK0402257.1 hypothetical protein [Adhaeribacter terrigena]
MNKKITYLLVLFLILDAGYSFYQLYYLPHDGDMAPLILPVKWYARVMEDPFGFSVFTSGEKYAAPNRFFAHWTMATYFKTVPFFLQLFTDPLSSSYLASALARWGTHLLLIWLLATYITGSGKWWKSKFILAAALIVPLFQTHGAFHRLNIISGSITYNFFYAFSLAVLMLFFLPFYRAFYQHKPLQFNFWQHLLLLALTLIVPLNGPLNAPLTLIICPSVLLFLWWQHFRKDEAPGVISRALKAIQAIPKPVLFYFIFISLVSVYSFYLGTFNIENDYSVSLLQRYKLLPTGLNQVLFYGRSNEFGPAYSLIFLTLILNAFLLRRDPVTGQRILKMLGVALLFCAIYVALLPMGGYRNYRPYIVVSHTFLPVFLVLIYFFGLSCWHILLNLKFRRKKFYIAGLVLAAIIFSSVETPDHTAYNCEKAALEIIINSPDQHVSLEADCSVMFWEKITWPGNSEAQGKLLQYWGATKDAKTYTTAK